MKFEVEELAAVSREVSVDNFGIEAFICPIWNGLTRGICLKLSWSHISSIGLKSLSWMDQLSLTDIYQ